MTDPLDDSQLTQHALGRFAERMDRMEARTTQAELMARNAESDRKRLGQDMRELRGEVREGFDDLRRQLAPVTAMTTAQKMVFAWLFALLTAAGVLVAIGDKLLVWIGQR